MCVFIVFIRLEKVPAISIYTHTHECVYMYIIFFFFYLWPPSLFFFLDSSHTVCTAYCVHELTDALFSLLLLIFFLLFFMLGSFYYYVFKFSTFFSCNV